jgi:hypothetical protein
MMVKKCCGEGRCVLLLIFCCCFRLLFFGRLDEGKTRGGAVCGLRRAWNKRSVSLALLLQLKKGNDQSVDDEDGRSERTRSPLSALDCERAAVMAFMAGVGATVGLL